MAHRIQICTPQKLKNQLKHWFGQYLWSEINPWDQWPISAFEIGRCSTSGPFVRLSADTYKYSKLQTSINYHFGAFRSVGIDFLCRMWSFFSFSVVKNGITRCRIPMAVFQSQISLYIRNYQILMKFSTTGVW